MIVGPQIQITDAKIVSTNISTAGEPAAYNGLATYAIGDQVTYENYVFESLQDANTGNTPPEENTSEWWVRVGAINKFKPFEHDIRRIRVYDRCENAGSITYKIAPGELFDMVGLFNLDAESISVVVTDPVAGEVYNSGTISLQDTTEIEDAWDHYFGPFDFAQEKVFFDLPPYKNAEIDITITSSATAKVGQIVIARQRALGVTLVNTEISTRSFSTFEKDFGGQFTSYEDRGSARRVEFQIAADTVFARRLQIIFDRDLEDRPAIYAAGVDTEQFGTTIFGRGSNFRLPLGTTVSFTTIEAEQFV